MVSSFGVAADSPPMPPSPFLRGDQHIRCDFKPKRIYPPHHLACSCSAVLENDLRSGRQPESVDSFIAMSRRSPEFVIEECLKWIAVQRTGAMPVLSAKGGVLDKRLNAPARDEEANFDLRELL
jgi:hypothetical protein